MIGDGVSPNCIAPDTPPTRQAEVNDSPVGVWRKWTVVVGLQPHSGGEVFPTTRGIDQEKEEKGLVSSGRDISEI